MSVRFFVRVRPERNERRWYVVVCSPTLFGEWSVLLSWGRLGSNWRQQRVVWCATREEAEERMQIEVDRRLRRGYVRLPVAISSCRLHVKRE